MILDPQGYVPTEIAIRTTIARNAFVSQPRQPRRPRRPRGSGRLGRLGRYRRLVEWTVPTHPTTADPARAAARRHRVVDGTV